MSVPSLPEQLLAVSGALDDAGVPHAFGGAIALGFHTREPRATRDLDVNIFLTSDRADEVLAALGEAGVEEPDETDRQRLRRDDQVRLWWGRTPIDLFFSVAAVHEEAARSRRMVRFADREIPVLAPAHLVLFKALFDREKDWVDIRAVVEAGETDLGPALRWVGQLVGEDDPRTQRLRAVLAG